VVVVDPCDRRDDGDEEEEDDDAMLSSRVENPEAAVIMMMMMMTTPPDVFLFPFAVLSATWLVFTSIIFFLPERHPTTAANMNYTIVVVGAVAIIGGLYWVVSARHFFKGPRRTGDPCTPKSPFTPGGPQLGSPPGVAMEGRDIQYGTMEGQLPNGVNKV
jgi:hypothetical protein